MDSMQSRLARAAMNVSLKEVAQAVGVTPNTISRIENGSDPKVSTLDALKSFYESVGVTFLPDDGDGPGVRFRAKDATA